MCFRYEKGKIMEPATIIAGLELAEKLKAPIADILSPTAELQKKYRWMVINIQNRSQFNMNVDTILLHNGSMFWDAPTTVEAFSSGSFSVSNKEGTILVGASGAVRFILETGGKRGLPVAVGFSAPAVGSARASVHLNAGPQTAYDNLFTEENKKETIVDGIANDGNPKQTALTFQTIPGQITSFTITQRDV